MSGLVHFIIRMIINSDIPEIRLLVIFSSGYPVIYYLNDLLRKFKGANSYIISEKLSAQHPLIIVNHYHTLEPVAFFCDYHMVDQETCLFWYLPV